MNTYILFLRAVNVGGNNRLPMQDFKNSLEKNGFEQVKSYIQSGNIALRSKQNKQKVKEVIEKVLHKDFSIDIRCFVFNIQELRELHQNHPFSEKQLENGYIIFTSRKITEKEQEQVNSLAQNNEAIFFTKYGIFLSYPDGYGKTKVHAGSIEKKLGIKATARNMRTFARTIALADE